MLPITQGVTSGVAEPVTFLSDVEEPETKTLVDAMTVAPSGRQRGEINEVIAALKLAGVWARCDLIYMLCAHDAQAARLNWKNPSSNALAVVNAPVFTANRGYAGDGVSAELRTAYTPVLFQQDDSHVSVFGLTQSATAVANDIFGVTITPGIRAGARNRTTTAGGVALNTNVIAPTTDAGAGARLISGTRVTATDVLVYANGAFTNSVAVASASGALTHAGFLSSGAAAFSDRQSAFGSIGASLTAAQHAALYSAVARYLQARGAI